MRKVEQELSGEEQEDDEKMQLMTLGASSSEPKKNVVYSFFSRTAGALRQFIVSRRSV